jgi:hypothetical protein
MRAVLSLSLLRTRAAAITVAALLWIVPLAGQAPAYKAPRTADGKPNLNGMWQVINTATGSECRGQVKSS